MPWARFDERFPGHRRIRRLSDAAFRLHVSGICWASEYLTDGRIASDDLVDVATIRKPEQAATELVKAGRWHAPGHDCPSEHCQPIADGWVIHDYLDYNPSKADVEATRSWDRKRQSLYRDKTLVDAIKRRDKDRCRYCGQLVNWTDRRSPLGGQLDHVIPRGPNTMDNVVVACRGCNIRKSDRTPAQADMALLDSGDLGSSNPSPNASSDILEPEPGDVSVPYRPVPTRTDPTFKVTTPSAQSTAQTLIGEWIDHCDSPPPSRVKGQIAKLVGQLLDEGQPYELVRRGLAAWDGKNLHPSALPSVVFEVAKGPPTKPNRASERNAAGFAVYAELAADEQRQELA